MSKQKVYFGYIEEEILQSISKLVEYLEDNEEDRFLADEMPEGHIFLDVYRLKSWASEIPVLSRFCWRLSIGLYVSLFVLMAGHFASHLGFFHYVSNW